MSKDPKPPSGPGLLSKVVKFVSNPTRDWKDLETHQSTGIDDPSAQQVRERIERKRRNDFIRATEFAQLRKVIYARRKQRQGAHVGSAHALGLKVGESDRPAGVPPQSSRAGTLQKIDEIERQMSKQWWRGDDEPTQIAAGVDFAVAAGKSKDRENEDAEDADSEFFLAGDSLFFAEAVSKQYADIKGLLTQEDGAQASNPWVQKWLAMEKMASSFGFEDIFVHEQDLEEAAILFASDRAEDAEKALVAIIRSSGSDVAGKEDVWLALFDLYRATGRQDRFDIVALEYARIFNKSAPVWFSLPQLLGKEEQESVQRTFTWVSPQALTLPAMQNLEAVKSRSAGPYQFNWMRLTAIDEAALLPLAKFLNELANQANAVAFSGAAHLLALVQQHAQVEHPEVNRQWWWLRLAILRIMNRQEDFEMVALDFTVTYEESPPAWQSSLAVYSNSEHKVQSQTQDEAQADASAPHRGQLRGRVEGDAEDALALAVERQDPTTPVVIDCSELISIDFPAAGSVLNWAALQQSNGRLVAFTNMHRLVATFFNIIGIDEHAKILVRKN